MCSEIAFHAPILAKLPVVGVLDTLRAVELLNPHTHAHIFHLEQLHALSETSLVNLEQMLMGAKISKILAATDP